jgi:hypothetical protein
MDKKGFNLIEFVKQNYLYMTVTDMVDETGEIPYKIQTILKTLGVKAVKRGSLIKNFILEHYRKKNKKWMAKTCRMTIEQINLLYHELNIEEPEELKEVHYKSENRMKYEGQSNKLSAGRILAEFTVNPAKERAARDAVVLAMGIKEEFEKPSVDQILKKTENIGDWKPDFPVTSEYLAQFVEEADKIFKILI